MAAACRKGAALKHNTPDSKNMGVPVRYVIGNHDYVHWGEYGEALFESIYGPVMYSFDVGQIHYIVTPIVYGDVQAKYTLQDVAVFLENDLKHVSPDKKVEQRQFRSLWASRRQPCPHI